MGNIQILPYEKISDGRMTNFFEITNSSGASVTLCDLGAAVVSIKVPDKNGELRDVVLGYEHVDGYEKSGAYFGATIGRCCGRISKGKFELNGETCRLHKNLGRHHLHGGIKNFSRRIWNYVLTENGVCFSLLSPDGDEGYPGDMEVDVKYEFYDDCVLRIEYRAVSDKDTVCNLTNHTYFNLNGHGSGDILNHQLKINAANFIEVDRELIPTGEILSVNDTPFDFSKMKRIGKDIINRDKQIKYGNGYDHDFILVKQQSGDFNELYEAAYAESHESGIRLVCKTTQPILHFYTPEYIGVRAGGGKDGVTYRDNCGFCFETQGFPNAVNQKKFPSTLLRAGDIYHHITEFAFSNVPEEKKH